MTSSWCVLCGCGHHNDVIMRTMASQTTNVSIIYSTDCSGTNQRKHQSSASLAFVWGFHRWAVNSPHKGTVTRKMSPLDDVIMPTAITLAYIRYSSITCECILPVHNIIIMIILHRILCQYTDHSHMWIIIASWYRGCVSKYVEIICVDRI